MRIHCPRCEQTVEVSRFRTAEAPARITFHCPACQGEVSLTSQPDGEGDAARPDAGAPGPAVDAVAAVAAVAPGPGAAAVAAADAVAAVAADPPAEASPTPPASSPESPPSGRGGDEVLWRAWDSVTDDFESEARHDAFLTACEAVGALSFAAARYREWAESHPGDTLSARRLQQVSALAQVKVMLTTRGRRGDDDPLRKALVLGLLLLAFVVLAAVVAPYVFSGVAGERPPRDAAGASPEGPAPPPRLQNLRPRRRPPPRLQNLRPRRRPGAAPAPDHRGEDRDPAAASPRPMH